MNKQQKEQQKELKEIYKECLKDVWGNDSKMIDYCLKTTSYIVELSNGDIIALEKPSIEKDFCFGYGLYGITNDEEEDMANNMVDVARNNEDYFMKENLKQVQEWIDELNNISDDSYEEVHIRLKYCSESEDNKLKEFYIYEPYKNTYRNCEHYKVGKEDIERIIKGYEVVKEDFTKRLNTYLKKYGLTKINAWTYLVD